MVDIEDGYVNLRHFSDLSQCLEYEHLSLWVESMPQDFLSCRSLKSAL